MAGNGRDALQNVRELSRDPPQMYGSGGRPLLISGSGRESLPVVWQ